MRFFILLLPWLELFTLIQLGIETSALTAILYVFATFALGLFVLRKQGQGVFKKLQEAQQGKVLGTGLLVDGMAVGLAGLLFMFPGMISDFAAIIVLIGPLRRRIARAISGPQAEPYAPQRDINGEDVIEGQYRRVDDDVDPK